MSAKSKQLYYSKELSSSRVGDKPSNVLEKEVNRYVKEFVEKDLGPEGLARSVIVVSTSDQPAPMRIRASVLATAISEGFRNEGKNVLLLMDSLTRFAMAQREIGLATGEPPASRGYVPSVFSMLPKILERTGTSATGAITAIYTVLVEGDDMNEPVADAVRGFLDGHIVLSRKLANANHFPAVDVLSSVSRLDRAVCSEEEIMENIRVVKGVAYSRDEAKMTLVSVADRPGVAAAIFGPLADAGVNVDMIVQNISEDGRTDMTFSCPVDHVPMAEAAMRKATSEGELNYRDLITDSNVAKISIVGNGMRSQAGVAKKMFQVLATHNANIQVITTSEIKISVLIDRKYMELVVRALHDEFELKDA